MWEKEHPPFCIHFLEILCTFSCRFCKTTFILRKTFSISKKENFLCGGSISNFSPKITNGLSLMLFSTELATLAQQHFVLS